MLEKDAKRNYIAALDELGTRRLNEGKAIEAEALVFGTSEKAGGDMVKQSITITNGIDIDTARKVVKLVKDAKLKVQAAIQGEEVRITGKQRDDLQDAIQTIKEGDYVSFDGLKGEIKLGQMASHPSEILQVVNGQLDAKKSDIYQRFSKLLEWADKVRRLGIRANADLPDQAELAYKFGAVVASLFQPTLLRITPLKNVTPG